MTNMSKIPCSRNSTDPIIVNLNYTTWWYLKCHVMPFWFISTQSSSMSLLVSTWGKPLTWEEQIPYTGTLPWSIGKKKCTILLDKYYYCTVIMSCKDNKNGFSFTNPSLYDYIYPRSYKSKLVLWLSGYNWMGSLMGSHIQRVMSNNDFVKCFSCFISFVLYLDSSFSVINSGWSMSSFTCPSLISFMIVSSVRVTWQIYLNRPTTHLIPLSFCVI